MVSYPIFKTQINCKVRAIKVLLIPVAFLWAPHPKQWFSKWFWTVHWRQITPARTSPYTLLSQSGFSFSLGTHRVCLVLFIPRCHQALVLGWARDSVLCLTAVDAEGCPGYMCWFSCWQAAKSSTISYEVLWDATLWPFPPLGCCLRYIWEEKVFKAVETSLIMWTGNFQCFGCNTIHNLPVLTA